jgi:hypothetical protein
MGKVRNHITYIKSGEPVAKANEDTEQKTAAEAKRTDPKPADAKAAVEKNVIPSKTVLDSFEKDVKEGKASPEPHKPESAAKNKPAEEGLSIAQPAASAEQKGKPVEATAKPQDKK